MLQYISYLQLCSNVLQNKLSRRQQKYIVNVYKNCTAFMGYNFLYMSIGSVVFFSSYVLRKRNEMPKIKGKIYINQMDLPIKNMIGKVLARRHHFRGRHSPYGRVHIMRQLPPPSSESGDEQLLTARQVSRVRSRSRLHPQYCSWASWMLPFISAFNLSRNQDGTKKNIYI